MANAVHPSIDFYPRPVTHAPSPFGFGFGLSAAPTGMVAGWPSAGAPGHFHQLAPTFSQPSPPRGQKRRHEPEEDADRNAGARDDAMDRSPTPERPKRAAPKRARMTGIADAGKDAKNTKENKPPGESDENDVDVGVLLASLPPQSLLSLLTSLLSTQPSLKSTILPLIPRPTLETAIQALALSAKKLREAYPYSNAPSFAQPSLSTPTFGFGSGSRSTNFGGPSAGFGRPTFGQSSNTPSASNNGTGGMRDSYIISRLRPHINEFVAACMSYLPYFSYIPPISPSQQTQSGQGPHTQPDSHSRVLQSLHKDKFHPSETFLFLAALTNHLLSQPPLTQTSLAPLLLPRLSEEWKAWVDRVDEVVNREGGMFGSETVRSWEKGLDEFAESKSEGGEIMQQVRDRWVSKVGWLVGRMVQHRMEEL